MFLSLSLYPPLRAHSRSDRARTLWGAVHSALQGGELRTSSCSRHSRGVSDLAMSASACLPFLKNHWVVVGQSHAQACGQSMAQMSQNNCHSWLQQACGTFTVTISF
ncbi:hypothetical protein ElyMa_000492400 [Elysia marginata]|uniref:Secreted protein n=1 Tax=Elysia marginata TaxID=1093978 RepID=A0AAV4FVP8_9GAST|nr:hypothetical protein ElyMa_000492400 [Elysia marginata]